ncbi:hypothetical protein [Ornithinibacillus sp. 179-J 7C1 HS]|uniref:hypothetical protein n=1 Tax=Ornithinibacillus sp. 179-J 7C1 HS TaxID=3142384 RepID=UPI0039A2B766
MKLIPFFLNLILDLVYGKGESRPVTGICDRTGSVDSMKVEADFDVLGQGTAPEEVIDFTDKLNKSSKSVVAVSLVGFGLIVITSILAIKWMRKKNS